MSVMKAVMNLSTCRVIEKEVKIEYIYMLNYSDFIYKIQTDLRAMLQSHNK